MRDPRKEKRCQSKQHGGCGQWYPLSEFPQTRRRRESGIKTYYGSWCRECQRLKDKKRNRKAVAEAGARNKRKPLHHTGPKPGTVEYLFFCGPRP